MTRRLSVALLVALAVLAPAAHAGAAAQPHRFPVFNAKARYPRSHHDYPAADIFAPCGSPVLAVTNGTVNEVSAVDTWNPKADNPAVRGGLSVAIVGDDGVRYYGSHLRSVAVTAGQRVTAGQVMGTVGNTGDARGIACHLHFGISAACGPGDWQRRRGTVWPQKYLDSWRKGGNVSPTLAVMAQGFSSKLAPAGGAPGSRRG